MNKLNRWKYAWKHQIPYYHPLTDWLLETTIGNQGTHWWILNGYKLSSMNNE